MKRPHFAAISAFSCADRTLTLTQTACRFATGRLPSLTIDAALKRREGRVAITAVHGVRRRREDDARGGLCGAPSRRDRATWWVRAQTADSMRADLVSLGVRLGWVAADEEAPAFEKVMERLRHEGEGLLIIYDNATQADALKPFLPKGGAACVLVTSNAPDWALPAARSSGSRGTIRRGGDGPPAVS